MNLITVFQRFPDHESCIEHLERIRWPHTPACPLCEAVNVSRKSDGDRIGRWNCRGCKSSFNVLSGTIFEKTKIELQKWFLAIALIANAKKSVSSYQLSRDLDLNQKTAWFMAMRIRRAMVEERELLTGIVEADEAYVGGKPRKGNKRDDDTPSKRGRGTDKLPVIGVVERGGDVVAEPSRKVDGKTLAAFMERNVAKEGTLLVTDEFAGYNQMGRTMNHAVIQHALQYVDGLIHTNTIEGFWGLLKRAWYGTHHHYSDSCALAYSVEACYKYNNRGNVNVFDSLIRSAVGV